MLVLATYDNENRILTVDGGATATYAYDALGERVRRTTGGTTFDNFYDENANVITYRVGAGPFRDEIFAGGIHIATYYASKTYFPHENWLGSGRVWTDQNGTVVQNCSYQPFGDNQNCTASDVSYLHYAGYERDPETTLDHMLFRYYNSRLGRFMSVDPAGAGLNWGNYSGNDPINATDPLGLCENDAGGDIDCVAFFDGIFAENGAPSSCEPWLPQWTCPLLTYVPPILLGGDLANIYFGGGASGSGAGSTRPPLTGETNGIPNGYTLRKLGLLDLLGIDTQQCEFGACGAETEGFQQAGDCGCILSGPDIALITLQAINQTIGDALSSLLFSKGGKQNIRPSWAEQYPPFADETGEEYATRVCAEKLKKDGVPCTTGPNSDFSKLKKWWDRLRKKKAGKK